MVLSKSLYRVVGTIAGRGAPRWCLIALFAQTPELFVLALALLVGGLHGRLEHSDQFPRPTPRCSRATRRASWRRTRSTSPARFSSSRWRAARRSSSASPAASWSTRSSRRIGPNPQRVRKLADLPDRGGAPGRPSPGRRRWRRSSKIGTKLIADTNRARHPDRICRGRIGHFPVAGQQCAQLCWRTSSG